MMRTRNIRIMERQKPMIQKKWFSGLVRGQPVVSGYEALERRRGRRKPPRKLTRREKRAMKKAEKMNEKLRREQEKQRKRQLKKKQSWQQKKKEPL